MSRSQLMVIRSMKELDFSQLMRVYSGSNYLSGLENYPQLSAAEQLLQAEQDFYTYLKEAFFRDKRALYAIWAPGGRYEAALRLEPYRDGLLLEALETAPEARGKGYATDLVGGVLAYLKEQGSVKVYSHIDMKNAPSLAVHRSNGFQKISDHALFADGSVSHGFCTCCYIT